MSLNNEFHELKDYFEENKEKPWQEWLKLESVFKCSGKQGRLGIFTSPDGKHKYIFKLSQYINYLVQHEMSVMADLNTISGYCPHFCKVIGALMCDTEPKHRKEGNPFKIVSKYPIEKEVMLMGYLENCYKFYNYIRSSKFSEKILFSVLKQTLMAISIAQTKVKFTHYDLHSNNIMLRKCDEDLVFLYVLDENNAFAVPTRGYYPVIIDFGFAYSQSLENSPLWPSLGHTSYGFMSHHFDSIADLKLLLVTVADEIHDKRKTKRTRKLKNISKNIFSPLKLDWDSGWDADCKKSSSDYVLDMLHGYHCGSPLFSEYDHFCIDIFQTLITLPLSPQKYDNIHVAYRTFVKEFIKIENMIGSPYYCLYILKNLVNVARSIREDYINPKSRNHALKYFRHAFYECVDSIAQDCFPKDLHYEKLLCSLYCLARGIEGVLYDATTYRENKKERMYSKLKVSTPEEIFAILDVNLEDDYTYNSRTTILVLNASTESVSTLNLTQEERERINDMIPLSQGVELYEIFKQKNNSHNKWKL